MVFLVFFFFCFFFDFVFFLEWKQCFWWIFLFFWNVILFYSSYVVCVDLHVMHEWVNCRFREFTAKSPWTGGIRGRHLQATESVSGVANPKPSPASSFGTRSQRGHLHQSGPGKQEDHLLVQPVRPIYRAWPDEQWVSHWLIDWSIYPLIDWLIDRLID